MAVGMPRYAATTEEANKKQKFSGDYCSPIQAPKTGRQAGVRQGSLAINTTEHSVPLLSPCNVQRNTRVEQTQ